MYGQSQLSNQGDTIRLIWPKHVNKSLETRPPDAWYSVSILWHDLSLYHWESKARSPNNLGRQENDFLASTYQLKNICTSILLRASLSWSHIMRSSVVRFLQVISCPRPRPPQWQMGQSSKLRTDARMYHLYMSYKFRNSYINIDWHSDCNILNLQLEDPKFA